MPSNEDRLNSDQRRQAEELFAHLDGMPPESRARELTQADCDEPVRAMQKCTLQKASLSHHLKMLAHLNKLYETICYSSALKANTKIVDHITSSYVPF